MTNNIESIAQAYEHARKTEKKFTFEMPTVVYNALLNEYGLKNDGHPSIVEGGFISTKARRVSPYFGSNLNRTPMVRGTLLVSGLSQKKRDELADKIMDHFRNNRVGFNFESVSNYEHPNQQKYKILYSPR